MPSARLPAVSLQLRTRVLRRALARGPTCVPESAAAGQSHRTTALSALRGRRDRRARRRSECADGRALCRLPRARSAHGPRSIQAGASEACERLPGGAVPDQARGDEVQLSQMSSRLLRQASRCSRSRVPFTRSTGAAKRERERWRRQGAAGAGFVFGPGGSAADARVGGAASVDVQGACQSAKDGARIVARAADRSRRFGRRGHCRVEAEALDQEGDRYDEGGSAGARGTGERTEGAGATRCQRVRRLRDTLS